MSIFPWIDKYSVYVEGIDLQHKKLVELLDTLALGMAKGKGKTILGSTLNELINYTVYHFGEEEKYFDLVDYPAAEKHQKEHEKLMEQVYQFKADFDTNKVGLTIDLMLFLKEWLINHINGTDKQLGVILNKAGIKK